MYDLFNPMPEMKEPGFLPVVKRFTQIPGLLYISNYLTIEEQKGFIEAINHEEWLTDIKRRVQHYGYRYDYKARTIDYSTYLGALPIWAISLAHRLHKEHYISKEPDQLIVNEYKPGQGIANHVDCKPCFEDTIVSISLGSICVMDFISLETREHIEVLLEPGSLVVISGEARYNWTHGIAQRKTDKIGNKTIFRKLRLSMTFRKVILK